MSQALAPADNRAFAVAMGTMVKFARVFGINGPGVAEAVEIYKRSLAHLPADVLVDAVTQVMDRREYRNFPLPGEILKIAEADPRMVKRRAAALAIGAASVKARLMGPRAETRAEEQARRAARGAERNRAAEVADLASNTLRRMG